MQFAPNFSIGEFELSQTATRKGIENSIPEDLKPNVVKLSWWLQELRNKINRYHRQELRSRELPIIISSGYRCPALNTAVGGSKTSAHCRAYAADITVPGMSARELTDFIVKHMTDYDQVIEEFGRWVHVGLADKPRGQVLEARKNGNRTVYRKLDIGA